MTTPSSDSIGEKVRFWEEQDKINQEMIPRVIRQHELLTKHISEHDNLPEIVGRVLVRAQEEQNQQYENALASAKAQTNQQIEAATQALTTAREEQNQQYEDALTFAKAEYDKQVQDMRQESRKTRALLVGITVGACLIAITSLIVAIVT
jgi:hypothetical protein